MNNKEVESAGHRIPEGKPISTTRYGLLNLIAKKVKEDGGDTRLKIIIAHNMIIHLLTHKVIVKG